MSNPSTETTSSFQNTFETAAFILAGAAGVSIFLCMPVVAPALVSSFGFDAKQVGEFSFVQLAFISLGSLLGLWVTRHFTMKFVAVASISVLLLMDVTSSHLENYALFLSARAVAGIAGGVAVAVATGALAQRPGVERNFGLFLFTQILLGMLGIWLIPQLVGSYGIKGVFYPLVTLELLVLIFCLSYVPALKFAEAKRSDTKNTRLAWFCSATSLVAMLCFFTAIGCYWTYVGLIGGRSGFTVEAVGWGLSLASIGGAIGALVPTFLQQRIGSLTPILLSAALLIIALYLTSNHTNLFSFVIAAATFTFGWYLFHPYQVGVLAAVDVDGRATMASAALTGLGLGLGPVLVSRFVETNMSVVYLVSGAGFLLAALMIMVVVLLTPRLVREREALAASGNNA